jgi:hypothetical protein
MHNDDYAALKMIAEEIYGKDFKTFQRERDNMITVKFPKINNFHVGTFSSETGKDPGSLLDPLDMSESWIKKYAPLFYDARDFSSAPVSTPTPPAPEIKRDLHQIQEDWINQVVAELECYDAREMRADVLRTQLMKLHGYNYARAT